MGTAAKNPITQAFSNESVLLASRLQQHQIDGDKSSTVMLQLSDLHCHDLAEGIGGLPPTRMLLPPLQIHRNNNGNKLVA